MICVQCGAVSDEGQRFCYNCGARLELQQQPAPQAPPTIVSPPQAPQAFPPAPAPIQPTSYQQSGGGYAPVVPNSNLAVISLVSGIVAWVLIPVLGAIVGVVAGHMAHAEIRRSGGSLTGQGLATVGMILGYAQLAIVALLSCLLVLALLLGVAMI
jgi:hypothetical protein